MSRIGAHACRLERVERGAHPVEQPLVVVPRTAHEALQPREVRVFHAGLDQRAVHEREQLDRVGIAERVEVEMLAQDLPLGHRLVGREQRDAQDAQVERAGKDRHWFRCFWTRGRSART